MDVVGAGSFKFLAGNRRENDFTLQVSTKFIVRKVDILEKMGEIEWENY